MCTLKRTETSNTRPEKYSVKKKSCLHTIIKNMWYQCILSTYPRDVKQVTTIIIAVSHNV